MADVESSGEGADLPICEYGARARSGLAWTAARWTLALGVGAFVVLLLWTALLPSCCRSRETDNRVKCGSNLRQIAAAMSLYADRNRGAYPPRLVDLVADPDNEVRSDVLVCPSSSDRQAKARYPDALRAELSEPHHVSYAYCAAGLRKDEADATTVLACEKIENHGDGMTVLFGDGHVEFMSLRGPEKEMLEQLLKDVAGGARPVRMVRELEVPRRYP